MQRHNTLRDGFGMHPLGKIRIDCEPGMAWGCLTCKLGFCADMRKIEELQELGLVFLSRMKGFVDTSAGLFHPRWK